MELRVPIGTVGLLALIVVSASAAGCGSSDGAAAASEVERLAETPPAWVDPGSFGRRLWAVERTFYERRGHLPAWIDGNAPRPQLDALLDALRQADRHGLDPASYGTADLAAERAVADEAWFGPSFDPARVPELDLRFTYAFLAYAADLLGWRLAPRAIDPSWQAATHDVDLASDLQRAIEASDIGPVLDVLAPAHPQYKGLQAALVKARERGDAARAERIALNLERWRWAPRDLGERHVLVNVPRYQMQVVEGEAPVLAMRVIVGAPETPTPLFSDAMTYVVFSPYWNIPESILREETLPRVAEDPDYLTRNNMEVVGTSGELVDPAAVDWDDEEAVRGLRFRQAPGPENALGLVKFIFPNHFSVYLHDTPGDALFRRDARALSHGCIRVENPVGLAEYVLSDRREWTPDRIVAAMHAEEERVVTLKTPLPVHIGYWTAWVEANGEVTFTADPYGIDRRHAAARARPAHGAARPPA
jgi:murein L,D-transpeptidase YcbB/YkuD